MVVSVGFGSALPLEPAAKTVAERPIDSISGRAKSAAVANSFIQNVRLGSSLG